MSISDLFSMLSFLILVLGIVGLFSPRRVLPFFRKPSRLKVILVYSLFLIITFGLVGATLTPEEKKAQLLAEAKRAEEKAKVKVEAEEEAKKAEEEVKAKAEAEEEAKKAEEKVKTKAEKEAKKEAEKAKAKDYLNLAEQNFAKGNIEEGEKNIDEALKLNSKLAEEADKLITLYKQQIVAHYLNKADNQFKNSMYKEAKKSIEKVLKLDDEQAKAYFIRGKLNRQTAIDHISKLDGLFKEKESSILSQGWKAATFISKTALKIDLAKEEFRIKRAKYYIFRYQMSLNAASDDYKKALELDSTIKQVNEEISAINISNERLPKLIRFMDIGDELVDSAQKAIKYNEKAKKAREDNDFIKSNDYMAKIDALAVEAENLSAESKVIIKEIENFY